MVTYLPTLFAMRPWRLRAVGPPAKVIDELVDVILAGLKIDQPS
jgi:hypothetical protein